MAHLNENVLDQEESAGSLVGTRELGLLGDRGWGVLLFHGNLWDPLEKDRHSTPVMPHRHTIWGPERRSRWPGSFNEPGCKRYLVDTGLYSQRTTDSPSDLEANCFPTSASPLQNRE